MSFNFHAATDSGGGDAVLDLNFHQHAYQRPRGSAPCPVTTSAAAAPPTAAFISASPSWTMPLNMASHGHLPASPDHLQANSPSSHASSPHSPQSSLRHSPYSAPPYPLTDLALQQHHQQAAAAAAAAQQQQHMHAPPDLSQFMQDPSLMGFGSFHPNLQPNPLDYMPSTTEAALHASLMNPAFNNLPSMADASHAMQWGNAGMDDWQDFQNTLQMDGLPRLDSVGSNSPTGTYLEVLSLPSSSGDGWAMVDWSQPNMDPFQPAQNAAIFNPSQTLHLRTSSDSSDGLNSFEFGSFEEVQSFPFSPVSPESDGHSDNNSYSNRVSCDGRHASHDAVSPPAACVAPVPVKAEPAAGPSSGSGVGSTSPPAASISRRSAGSRKNSASRPTNKKAVVRRISNGKKDGSVEKKIGRRKGPLLPEQRKQASEIRKLRACLRCKFLKKTCDKGEPCAGCQPSHARLWQVPCTRIDIKDIGYFMKDWKADFVIPMAAADSLNGAKGFSQRESLMWITHGYGFALPVTVREVFVTDESCLQVDWVESYMKDQDPVDFEAQTEKLDVGAEGISLAALSEYLDKHIDGPFDDFIDDHFEGTPFITEILKTAHRYYLKDRMPVIRKALKLVLAYNLTMHITMVENQGAEVEYDGRIRDRDSKYYGRTVAPRMVHTHIRFAMADMWRELQKDILEELSSLYSGVYSGEKMKNWPTIFMLASILLAVWEEMQFDSHYRVPDPVSVSNFCMDMERTPVGVIVGLFHAISQKLPAFNEWDTHKHGHLVHNNVAVCDAMTEVRDHVIKHGRCPSTCADLPLPPACGRVAPGLEVPDIYVLVDTYLRSRKDAQFDRDDFDSLSNKFLSKLVIRAN